MFRTMFRSRIHGAAGACELLHGSDRESDRRRLRARDPRWEERQRARVADLFVDRGDE
ncbi:hypothetical protein [Nocardiopsis sp. CNR-923]|uniref:hypothetical protein n=1 Tax=Nocardiopsis sp. CNR-923 TaxID=1904965 RepID=UPI0013017671|nr:hypothetical protein [Nocardiopsis sp. CNR-923]